MGLPVSAITKQEITTKLRKLSFIDTVSECNSGWMIKLKQGTKSPFTIYSIITMYTLCLQGYKVLMLDHEWEHNEGELWT